MRPRGIYPANLVFTTVFQANEGSKDAQNGVIRSDGELRKALRSLVGALASKVSFGNEQLIFVALGRRDSGHEAQITSVMYVTDRGGLPPLTEVSYKEITPMLPAFEQDAEPTYPIHVIKVKKLDGETTFNKN
jgi:hypothetical protein